MRHPFHFCDVRQPPAAWERRPPAEPAAWETRPPAETGITFSHAALATVSIIQVRLHP